jgi:hypothetical protein
VRTSLRVCHDGKRTECRKVWHEIGGMGVRWGEEMLEVEVGVKGEVLEGVRRALREVLIVSSMAERERRRKSARARSLKQNAGVRGEGGG